jgi:hypothetical protein
MKSFLFQRLAVLGGDLIARMPAVQTSYGTVMAPAYEGMKADSRLAEISSYVVETAAGIGYGKVAVQGTGDRQVRVSEAARPLVGITEAVHQPEGSGLADLFPQYANIPIIRTGPVWVMASVAVTPGALAYYVPATGVLNVTAASNNLIGRWETTTSGAGLAVLWVFRPQVAQV